MAMAAEWPHEFGQPGQLFTCKHGSCTIEGLTLRVLDVRNVQPIDR